MFQVCVKQCDQCLYSKDRIVSAERVRDVLATCKEDDTFFVCHKTDNVCCRGFYDHGSNPTVQQISDRLGLTEFVPVPKDKS